MGRLSEYDEQEQAYFSGFSITYHSDSLPRTDGDLSNWTTEVKLQNTENPGPVFTHDKNRDIARSGGRVLPKKVKS